MSWDIAGYDLIVYLQNPCLSSSFRVLMIVSPQTVCQAARLGLHAYEARGELRAIQLMRKGRTKNIHPRGGEGQFSQPFFTCGQSWT